VFFCTQKTNDSVIRTWREKRVGAPSLTAAKPRLSVADSSLATAAPWEPYFTDNDKKSEAAPVCDNEAMYHEDMREWANSFTISPQHKAKVSVQHHTPAALCLGKMAHGTHWIGDWSGRYREEKNLALARI
jgi:hypothetical protein